MADEPTKTPGSITQTADTGNERISEISNINRTISNMQKQIDQQLTQIDQEVNTSEAISEVQNSMTKVLNKMGTTVGQIGMGFSRIAADTARSGRDMISEYSKAIQQDINYNKQNMVAMALSRTSPIFGYYVSKFMETDVWKSATERMKSNIGNALSSVGQKFKSAISGISFRRRSKSTEESAETGKNKTGKIPHMQSGGIVQKAGLAKLHAAEVVMPVEKLLSRIDEQIDITKTLAQTVERGQVRSIAKLSTYVGDAGQRQEKSIFRAFLKAMHQVQSQYEDPAEKRMLRALLAIQDALGAQLGTWQQVWQKMIITNPVFRNAMITANIMRKIFAAPFQPVYAFFAGRGGYEGHLSSSRQPLQAMTENIGVLYTGSMHRLDRITLYTMATAEAVRDLSTYVTGKSYKELEGIKTGRWSFFGGARGLVNWMTKWSIKGAGRLMDLGQEEKRYTMQADALAEALTKNREWFWENWGFGGQQKKLAGGLAATGFESPEQALIRVFSNDKLLSFVDKQGALPVTDLTSSKMLELSEKTYQLDNKEAKHNKKLLQITDENWRENKQANERERRRTVFGFLSGGFGALKGILSSVMGFIPMLLGMFGIGSLGGGGGIGGFFTKILTGAFLGKGATAGKGGILGAMGRKAVDFIKSIKIRFPKGFLRKIGPALLGMGRNIAGLAGSIAGRFAGLFAAGGPIVSALGPALAVAAAGVIGWKIGKSIDNVLGISEKFQAKMAEWDKKAADLNQQVSAITQANVKKAREGSKEGYEARRAVGLTAGIPGGDEYNKSVGFWGQQHVATIADAQRKYMQNNINEYLPYHPEVIKQMRAKWLKAGGYGGKGIGIDAEYYGRHREADFLKYLKTNAKPMSEQEASEHYSAYKKQFGIVDQARMAMQDMYGSAKEKVGGAYIKVTDVAKNQVKEMAITGEVLKNELKETSKKYYQGMKEVKDELVGATNAQTVVVSNTLQNAHSTMVQGGRAAMAYAQDQYSVLSSKGEVDGD